MYEFMKQFKHYLYGKRFLARTDHLAIKYIQKTKKPITPQFQTWLNEMAEFDFDLEFRSGTKHSNADGLSRLLLQWCSQCQSEHVGGKTDRSKVRFLNILKEKSDKTNINKFIEGQKQDKDIQQIVKYLRGECLEEISKSPYKKHISKFKIHDDVLYIEIDKSEKMIIANSQRFEFIKYIHKEMCHIGIKKTFTKKKNF